MNTWSPMMNSLSFDSFTAYHFHGKKSKTQVLTIPNMGYTMFIHHKQARSWVPMIANGNNMNTFCNADTSRWSVGPLLGPWTSVPSCAGLPSARLRSIATVLIPCVVPPPHVRKGSSPLTVLSTGSLFGQSGSAVSNYGYGIVYLNIS